MQLIGQKPAPSHFLVIQLPVPGMPQTMLTVESAEEGARYVEEGLKGVIRYQSPEGRAIVITTMPGTTYVVTTRKDYEDQLNRHQFMMQQMGAVPVRKQ